MTKAEHLGSEFDVVQNDALAALVLWTFAKSFFDKNNQAEGPTLPQALPVLPLLFNGRTLESICTRVFEGGLYRAVADDRLIPVGLQQRMIAMTEQTFRALNFAFAAGLLTYDSDHSQILPVRKTPAFQVLDEASRKMMAGAKRLGHWFADLTQEQVFILLDVRF